ncbi:MAG: type II toxin-antitoxin system prevent-host-death family antitoxin [Beijerinckiaceae bacterium]|jgi:prevent-host-death family protein
MWSVADAKAQLSEILRRARAGQPQFIGTQEPCVVISAEVYRTAVADMSHDGQWLIEQAGHLGFDIPEPSRREDRRDLVFED